MQCKFLIFFDSVILISVCALQVDLFFYREPEEAKGEDDEETGAIVGADYGIEASDNWGGLAADTQWTSEPAAAPVVAAEPVADWQQTSGSFMLSVCS